jgi:hypothetical protein
MVRNDQFVDSPKLNILKEENKHYGTSLSEFSTDVNF